MDFKVFCLNCWGVPIPGVSKDRKQRFRAIAEVLAISNYDIVCLQEVWTDSDFNLIRDKVKNPLPFSHYFYSGVIGSGVCFFSKHPILEVFFHRWAVNGYVHKVQHGDWFGGKGIGFCKLKVNGFNINVYSAHLHAEYNRKNDEYQCHRVQQAYDSAQFINLTSSSADVVILAGDLNTEPGDLAYRIIVHLTRLKDSFDEVDDTFKKIHESGTNEAFFNSYTSKKAIESGDATKRIDYILFHGNPDVKVHAKRYCNPLPTRVPDRPFSYSDHEAIAATLRIERGETEVLKTNEEVCMAILDESILISDLALQRLKTKKFGYWLCTSVCFLILLSSTSFNLPKDYGCLIHVVNLFVTAIMCYAFFMGSLWYKTEVHGILAGKLAMEVTFNKCSTQK